MFRTQAITAYELRKGEVWKQQFESASAKAHALIEAVESTGIEPFEQPERFPRIDLEEVRLVCCLEIQSE
ncbi:MAG: hypothetical protein CBC12_08155 [Candidatus Puniceispirillum sp. TMED52]|nr:MAG: hypothetical protein CBC12_08155 [Candidatus Puniceispirillum sp. TMED52]